MPILEVTDLGKIYQNRSRNLVALGSLSLTVGRGEGVGILGPHGSGKSTLFRILAGLSYPTTGEALLNERPINDPKARLGVGFVPENPGFPPELTGLAVAVAAAGWSETSLESSAERAMLALEQLELAKWAETPVAKFTQEMTRRLALAVAIVPSPHLIVVDEPSEKHSRLSRSAFTSALVRKRKEGVAILHLAHSVSLLEKTVDRVLFLEQGRTTGEMQTSDLIDRPHQIEIEAEIGERLVELPEELGQIVSITRHRLVVEIPDDAVVSGIIDHLRLNHIRIQSVTRRELSPDTTWISSRATTGGAAR